MRLFVLNSGSKANGYVLHNDQEALIIECGCPYSQCLRAIGFNRKKIVGAIVTHEHGDHAKFVSQYLDAAIPVFASQGTIDGFNIRNDGRKAIPVQCKKPFKVGKFTILPFDTKHDSNEPFGYVISHPEIGCCLFATDTYYLKYVFGGLTQIMLECNYENGIIEKNVEDGVIPPIVRDRVFRSHMSLDTTISTLRANDLSQVNNIVLLHLSGNNSNPELFTRRVEEATGKVVHIAKRGLDISFDKEL